MRLFHKTTPPPPTASGPAIPAEHVPAGLVNLSKTATVSLTKQGLLGRRAAVYLVVDRSASMLPYYRNGAVQHLAEQALGLSVNLDDDGIVPLVLFDSRAYEPAHVSLTAYQGVIATQHARWGGDATMGGTRYALAMQAVLDHRSAHGVTGESFVIFETDGQPQDAEQTKDLLRKASRLPVFWSFVGFGASRVPFLQQLDTLGGRAVDNASYFHAGGNPQALSDAALYDGVTAEYGPWLAAAAAAGILP